MEISVAQAQVFFLALTRILAVIIHVPVIGGRTIPNQVKIGLGFLLAIIMLPWQPIPADASAIPTIEFAFSIGKELLVGTLAGFAAILTFSTFQIAGNLMSLGSGFSAGQILNPVIDASSSSMDQIFLMTSLMIFLVLNGHHLFFLGLQRTFSAVPLNSAVVDIPLPRLIDMTGGLITAGIQMSMPVMGTLLLTDLTLGLLAKVAPQMQVFFLGIPLKVGIGLIALAMAFSILLPIITQLFQELGARMLNLVGV